MATSKRSRLLGVQKSEKKKEEVTQSLQHVFAKASILAKLLQSQLATPLFYPMNSRTLVGDGIRLSNINNPVWDKATLAYGLSQVAPAMAGLTKVATLLRAGHALSFARGRSAFMKNLNQTDFKDTGSLQGFRNHWHPKHALKVQKTAVSDNIHYLRKPQWKIRRPGFESSTYYRKWRPPSPRKFVKNTHRA